MSILRAADDRFTSLSGYDFTPKYHHVEDRELRQVRVH
jgi:hypothetical protein